jgi:hypothetical protein
MYKIADDRSEDFNSIFFFGTYGTLKSGKERVG